MKIGFIGLGIMGSRMAHNLLKNNYTLIVHNRTKEKAESLLKAGAEWADSPAVAAGKADILFTMLSTPAAVKETALGRNGFLGSLGKNSLWIDCSTVNPSFSIEMAGAAREKGIRFIDAPAAGTKGPAERAELIFFAGGDKNDLEEARPLLGKMGKKINYMGECGKGTSMKLVINLILGVSMASFSEAMILGESFGFDRDVLLDLLIGGPVAAPYLGGKKEKFADDEYEAEFPLKWMRKDLELVMNAGKEQNITLPVSGSAKEIFELADKKGYSELDFSALLRFMSAEK